LNPAVLKTVIRKYRGFESPSLFQKAITRDKQIIFPVTLLNDSFQFISTTSNQDLIENVIIKRERLSQRELFVETTKRRDAREADRGRLLICCTRKGTRGSNPRLSASS
jgi:hypothetical protein